MAGFSSSPAMLGLPLMCCFRDYLLDTSMPLTQLRFLCSHKNISRSQSWISDGFRLFSFSGPPLAAHSSPACSISDAFTKKLRVSASGGVKASLFPPPPFLRNPRPDLVCAINPRHVFPQDPVHAIGARSVHLLPSRGVTLCCVRGHWVLLCMG